MMAWVKRFDRDDLIKITATLVLVAVVIALFLLGRGSANDAEKEGQRAERATTRATEGEIVAAGVAGADVCESETKAAKVGMASLCQAAAALAERAEEQPLPSRGADGKDSTVPGPPGASGAPGKDSTVPGPGGASGAPGKDSTVPGPPGADSTVPGPPGASGAPGAPGSPGADATGTPGKDGADGVGIKTIDVKCVPAAPGVRDGIRFIFTFTDDREPADVVVTEAVSRNAC